MTQVPPQPVIPVCYRHPKRETWVRCTRCNRPICPECMTEASVGFQCPECVTAGRRAQRPVRTAFGGTGLGREGYVTKSLIAINVLMLLFSTISAGGGQALAGGRQFGGLLGGGTPLMEKLGVIGLARLGDGSIGGIADGEYYRLITAMFMHYGLIHLALNMWGLWILGRDLELVLGPARFATLYVLAGLGGNVAAYVFTPNALTAGASTAIFGLFGALFVILRRLGRNASAILPVIIINVIFTLSVPGISIPGHIGGLITGTLVAFGFAYAPKERRNVVQALVAGAVLVLLASAAVVQTAHLAV